MTMEDNDVIIDLTELMDEEESAKKDKLEKPAAGEKTLKLETDTFDLGEELTKNPSPKIKDEGDLDFDKIFKESLNGIVSRLREEPVKRQESIVKEPSEASPADRGFSGFQEMPGSIERENVHAVQTKPPIKAEDTAERIDSSAAVASIMPEIRIAAESALRALISELVGEIASSMKKELPGIVEKVIREEIEKLKKID